MTVSRHDFPTENASQGLEFLKEDAQQHIAALAESPNGLGEAFDTTVRYAQALCLLDPEADKFETWAAFVTAMQIGHAMFDSAVTSEPSRTYRIDRQLRSVPASGVRPHTNADNWITAMWLAVICREKTRINDLCAIPTEALRASGEEFDEYLYSWIEALKDYWLQRPALGTDLVAAVQGTEPAVVRVAQPDQVLKIAYPPMELFQLFLRGEHDRFNATLEVSLSLHKDFWTADEDRATSIPSLVALGPLAVTCLAYDAGFPISVESPYLPKYLIDRGWVGEFDT